MIRVPSNEIEYDFESGINLLDGKPFTGIAYDLYPNGALSAETKFRDGLCWGVARGWYPDGRLSGEGSFLRDVRHGIARKWDQTGRLVEESLCESGVVIHKKRWNAEGVLMGEYQIQEGSSDYAALEQLRAAYGKEEGPHGAG